MRLKKALIATALAAAMLITDVFAVPVSADTQVLETTVSKASDGCEIVGLRGSFLTDAQAALDKINEYRKEACEEGVPYPGNPSRKLTSSDYVEIKWSSALESVARVRAAEAAILRTHLRTNGTSVWDGFSVDSNAEDLAWNSYATSMLDGLGQWYAEKDAWVEQRSGEVTGHYTSMIDPARKYVGLGLFYTGDAGYKSTLAGRLASSAGSASQEMQPEVRDCIQKLDLKSSVLGDMLIQEEGAAKNSTELQTGDEKKYLAMQKASGTISGTVSGSSRSGTVSGRVVLLDGVTWTSSSPSIAEVSEDGTVTAKSAGSVTITAERSDGKSAALQLTVKDAGASGGSAASASPSAKASGSPAASASPSAKASGSPAASASPSAKASGSPAASASPSAKASGSPAASASPSAKASGSPAASASPSAKASGSPAASASPSAEASGSPAASASPDASDGSGTATSEAPSPSSEPDITESAEPVTTWSPVLYPDVTELPGREPVTTWSPVLYPDVTELPGREPVTTWSPVLYPDVTELPGREPGATWSPVLYPDVTEVPGREPAGPDSIQTPAAADPSAPAVPGSTAASAVSSAPGASPSITPVPTVKPSATVSPTVKPTDDPDDDDEYNDEDGTDVPTVSKVSSVRVISGKRKLTVRWKKLTGAAYYQIQLSTKKSFAGASTYKISNTKSMRSIKGLKSKKTYYVRIRACKKYKTDYGDVRFKYGSYTVKKTRVR